MFIVCRDPRGMSHTAAAPSQRRMHSVRCALWDYCAESTDWPMDFPFSEAILWRTSPISKLMIPGDESLLSLFVVGPASDRIPLCHQPTMTEGIIRSVPCRDCACIFRTGVDSEFDLLPASPPACREHDAGRMNGTLFPSIELEPDQWTADLPTRPFQKSISLRKTVVCV